MNQTFYSKEGRHFVKMERERGTHGNNERKKKNLSRRPGGGGKETQKCRFK